MTEVFEDREDEIDFIKSEIVKRNKPPKPKLGRPSEKGEVRLSAVEMPETNFPPYKAAKDAILNGEEILPRTGIGLRAYYDALTVAERKTFCNRLGISRTALSNALYTNRLLVGRSKIETMVQFVVCSDFKIDFEVLAKELLMRRLKHEVEMEYLKQCADDEYYAEMLSEDIV